MPSLLPFKPNDDTWDEFVVSHRQAHLMQLTTWGELKSRFGWSVQRVALPGASHTIVSGAQVLYRRLAFGLGTIAYVPKGPVVDWDAGAALDQTLAALEDVARASRAIVLTIEPDLPDSEAHASQLLNAGFVRGAASIQPRRSLLVDLEPDEDTILARMKSKTRYNIRLSARKGVTVRQGTSADVHTFNSLMAATGKRQGFGVRSPDYYRTAFELFDRCDQVGLFLATHQGEPLAGLMAFALGTTAWYFHGASSERDRELMAPYAVQWAAMCWAKSKGCATYDLWGVPDEDEETLESQFTQRQDDLWGVYRNKRGYGGRLVRTVGAWDRIYGLLRYRLYKWVLDRRG